MLRKMSVLAVLVLSVVLTALAPAAAQDEFVFGMVLVGPQDDRGWSQAHYEGGLYVEENLPGARMLVFESLNAADTPETTLADVVELFVEEGAQVIFTTSDAFEEDTAAVAEQYPDVVFINVSGDDVLIGDAPANLGNVMAKIEWARLLAGCAGALASETGKIGYVGPLINAETRRVAASAYLGARHCWETYKDSDTELEFAVTWIGFWFAIPGVTLDVTEETNRFFDNGFDVVMSGVDTAEMVNVAAQRQADGQAVYSVPYNSIAGCTQAPEACLGVPFYNWGLSYFDLVASVQEGTWEQAWDWTDPTWESINDPAGTVTGFALGEGLTEEQLVQLEEFTAEVAAYAADEANVDTIYLWAGPLNLQDGTPLAEEGEMVDPLDVWYLPQLLEGMDGASVSE
ncbi:MAG: BMP family ABC transporter substrate-binding protein [Anaerolineae bacterium]|jgi:simple sugar transport system substrate-binding protein|nr:BMP family ABC transporter substrate-binding protein [Anaerolineae bacterium]